MATHARALNEQLIEQLCSALQLADGAPPLVQAIRYAWRITWASGQLVCSAAFKQQSMKSSFNCQPDGLKTPLHVPALAVQRPCKAQAGPTAEADATEQQHPAAAWAGGRAAAVAPKTKWRLQVI